MRPITGNYPEKIIHILDPFDMICHIIGFGGDKQNRE